MKTYMYSPSTDFYCLKDEETNRIISLSGNRVLDVPNDLIAVKESTLIRNNYVHVECSASEEEITKRFKDLGLGRIVVGRNQLDLKLYFPRFTVLLKFKQGNGIINQYTLAACLPYQVVKSLATFLNVE